MKIHELPAYAYLPARCPESAGFQAECAEIPGLIAYGKTAEEALEEIKIAVCGSISVDFTAFRGRKVHKKHPCGSISY